MKLSCSNGLEKTGLYLLILAFLKQGSSDGEELPFWSCYPITVHFQWSILHWLLSEACYCTRQTAALICCGNACILCFWQHQYMLVSPLLKGRWALGALNHIVYSICLSADYVPCVGWKAAATGCPRLFKPASNWQAWVPLLLVYI